MSTTTESNALSSGGATVPPIPPVRRKWPLHTKILLGLAVGALAGLAVNTLFGKDHPAVEAIIVQGTQPIGELFLRLLIMIVIPLIFSSLVSGVSGYGDLRTLGRVGIKTLGYTVIFSAISVALGILLTNTIAPGRRLDPATASALQARFARDAGSTIAAAQQETAPQPLLTRVMKTLIPSNPLNSAASERPDMMHVMVFSLLLGIALAMVPKTRAEPLLGALDALYAACAKLIDLMMQLAPYAVACLLFTNTARFGIDLIRVLALFLITVLLGLGIHLFGVYSLSVYFLARMSPRNFFRRVKTAMLTAFSTSSSNATLPTALRVGEQNLGIPREINSFVLTVGATANQNGTALYEGVTVLFLAQLAGMSLTLGQQITVAGMAILGGIGTAGIPAGSIPFVIVMLTTLKINPELIAIILGVDRLLDMCRTTLNVTGDLAAAAYVSHSEGHPVGQTESDLV